jgi:hypothetical protein
MAGQSTAAVTVVQDADNAVEELVPDVPLHDAFTFMCCKMKGGVELTAGDFVLVKTGAKDFGVYAKILFMARILKTWSPEKQVVVPLNSKKQFVVCVETTTDTKVVPIRHVHVFTNGEADDDLVHLSWLPDTEAQDAACNMCE